MSFSFLETWNAGAKCCYAALKGLLSTYYLGVETGVLCVCHLVAVFLAVTLETSID
jgi:hypothetical protein